MNANAIRWLAALRSGEYRQTKHTLKDDTGYCCLGVACELYRLETGKGEWIDAREKPRGVPTTSKWFSLPNDEAHGLLNDTVQHWLGLESNSGIYFNYSGNYASGDNDNGRTFEEIADRIEDNAERMFVNDQAA